MTHFPSLPRFRAALAIVVLASVACREQTSVPATATAAGGENALVISRHEDRIFAGGVAPPAEKFTNSAFEQCEGGGGWRVAVYRDELRWLPRWRRRRRGRAEPHRRTLALRRNGGGHLSLDCRGQTEGDAGLRRGAATRNDLAARGVHQVAPAAKGRPNGIVVARQPRRYRADSTLAHRTALFGGLLARRAMFTCMGGSHA